MVFFIKLKRKLIYIYDISNFFLKKYIYTINHKRIAINYFFSFVSAFYWHVKTKLAGGTVTLSESETRITTQKEIASCITT